MTMRWRQPCRQHIRLAVHATVPTSLHTVAALAFCSMNPTPPPIYLDWTFWAFVVAALALILSQLPSVPVLLRRAAITLQPYDRLNVTHYLGNPNINLHVQLRNTGGRAVRVSSLSLEITRDDGKTMTLPAQSFTRPEGPAGTLIFTPFTLEVNKEWANFVSFFVVFSAADERESKRLAKDLRADINAKLLAFRLRGEESKDFVEAEPARVEPLLAFFREHRFWQPGEFSARLIATCDPSRASVTRRFRYTLFESDVQDLDEHTLRYKNGFGVYLTDAQVIEVYPRIQSLV